MNDWQISLKWYPHFDATISPKNAMALVADPTRVAANKFYPFMRYHEIWQPYRSKPTGKPDKKDRPIRFASRRDAYILSYYRHLLSEKYELTLASEDISDVVIAYRKLKTADGAGKSNIEFC